MPTLPLHLPIDAVPPGASHRVTSPGGYEQWTVEATGTDGDVRVVATFYDGCPLNPQYVRRYARYRQWPTRLRPPVPRDYPAVHVTVFERGRALATAKTDYPPGACAASSQTLDVRIGDNRLVRDANGIVRLVLHGDVDAELELRPANGNGEFATTGDIRVRGRSLSFTGGGILELRFDTSPPPAARSSRRLPLVLLFATVLLVFAGRIFGPSDLHDKSQPKTVAYTADVVLHGRWMLPRDMVGGPARKPPLYNWVGAPFVAVLGYHEWVLKIPAMLSGVGAVAVSVLMTRRLLA